MNRNIILPKPPFFQVSVISFGGKDFRKSAVRKLAVASARMSQNPMEAIKPARLPVPPLCQGFPLAGKNFGNCHLYCCLFFGEYI